MTTAPTFPAELEEMIADVPRLTASIRDGSFGTQIQRYAENYARTRDGEETRAQIDAAVQQALAAWEHSNPASLAALGRPNLAPSPVASTSRLAPVSVYNPKALGAGKYEKEWASWADFYATTWHGNKKAEAAERLQRIRNDYSSVDPATGGYLIPENLRAQVLSVALEQAVMRGRSMVVPMDSLKVPFPTIDVTSNASSVHGGLVAYWTEESAQMTESEAKFGRVVLDAKTLTIYGEAPNQLFADSIMSFEAFIAQKLPEAVAWFEDTAFIRGTGVGEPLGWLNCDAMVSITKQAGQLADTVVWENIVKAYARMLPGSLSRAIWVINSDVLPELFTMALSVGTGGSAIFMQNGAAGAPMTLLGRPIVITEKVNTLGDEGDINFIDPGYYLIGDRQQMQSATSEHHKFQHNQTAFRVVERVDGRPWIQSAITPQNSSNTLSPFVNIEARA